MSSSALKTLPDFDTPDAVEGSRFDFTNLTEFDVDGVSDAAAAALSLRFDTPLEPDAKSGAASVPSSPSQADSADDIIAERDTAAKPDTVTTAPVAALEPAAPQPEVTSNAQPSLPSDTELQDLVSELSGALQSARAEMQTQLTTALNEMVESLLPALGREFLCDEVARHIPNLIPERVFGVEIVANPALAEKLEALFEQDGAIPANAIIRPMPGKATGSISINWGEGGYDFEFEPMLARCRQRLVAKQSD